MTEGKGYRETCPKCNSDDCVAEDMDPMNVSFSMMCQKCKASWMQYYEPSSWVYEEESK